MFFDNTVHQRQAQAGTAARWLAGDEGFEQGIAQCIRNAVALILQQNIEEVTAWLTVHGDWLLVFAGIGGIARVAHSAR